MTKPFREMTLEELRAECNIWWKLYYDRNGFESIQNGAKRLYEEASVWRERRERENN